jgi:hypothetical protein
MEINLKVFGKKTKEMAKEKRNGKTVILMMEIGKMI